MKARLPILRASAVHLYTALGLPLAFMALLSVFAGQPRDCFMWLLAATIIDGTDGPLARRFDVKRWTPRFDGRKLDDITDYLTYVFVPLAFIWHNQLVTGVGLVALFAALLASGYGFSNDGAKTDDKHFTGFPSYWNGVALLLFWARLPSDVNAVVVLALAILVVVPVKFPSTQAVAKWELIALGGTLLLTLCMLLFAFDQPIPALVALAMVYPVYHILSALARSARQLTRNSRT